MTGTFEDRVRAFEAAVADVRARSHALVRELADEPDGRLQHLLAERLPGLGDAVVPELDEIMAAPGSSPGLRYLAARAALELGDDEHAVRVLCDHVEGSTRWAVAAAGVLGRHRLRAGLTPVRDALRRVDPGDGVAVVGYADALHELGEPVPNDVRARLAPLVEPWVVRVLDREVPGGSREA
ncbi:hypothetical protein [Cellulomonas cellasea]|uniref:HEAT repeat domain-containing protein n=1 Tax=Cellulomonas cellasea TaxID=43670 RepID=A0A7W4UJU7_9CELL|nr:hypothetical protein [Cellulomonas cellasea]MBB2924873.1 hypothetical protein [Cellulomonas cellasea]